MANTKDTTCSVCLEEKKLKRFTDSKTCTHEFCNECLDSLYWYPDLKVIEVKCPLCRERSTKRI